MTISRIVSTINAVVLGGGGFGLLFAPDLILRALAPGMPVQAQWIGQLLAAAWLAMASFNWLQRTAVIGGIYTRPLVYSNFVLHLVSSLTMVRVLKAPDVARGAWLVALPMFVLAIVYAALLFRGPFDSLHGAAPRT